MTPLLGVVCGLAAEADALGPLKDDPRIAVRISGARAGRAEALAEDLAGLGVRALVSWGLAGGLVPDAVPGRLYRPGWVLDGKVARCLAGSGAVTLLGSDSALFTAAEKAAAGTRAAIVDMETHRVARVAARHGLRAHAIRAVSDGAEADLPLAVRDAVNEDGTPRLGPVIRGLLRRPWELPALLRTKRGYDAALKALSGEGRTMLSEILAGIPEGVSRPGR